MRDQQKKKGCDVKMAVMAKPNKNSYVIKKSCVSEFSKRKIDSARLLEIKKSAELFAKNNLKSGKK